MHFTPLELERFRATATAIRDGSFDIKRDVVPPGYVNFCVLHADDPDPFLRYPLPPAFGRAQTAQPKKPKQTRRGKRESGYLTRVIFDRFAADTATRKRSAPKKTIRTHRTLERANANNGGRNYRRPGPYQVKGRNGGRNEERNEPTQQGVRPKFFKNRSRNFRTTEQNPPPANEAPAQNIAALLNDPVNNPFRELHNLVPNVDAMFKDLEINSTIDGSQGTPVPSTAGPSTGWTLVIILLVNLLTCFIAATSPMNSVSTN
ncbi:hypothetical protein EDD15DRAFT_2191437 [Pisolithus albus]|nr:hypothetical protein EDD15DRAFT_2191437 [Pisolithus albus]